MKVLHVILKVQATNGQYHEHCLPLAAEREITICSFLPATLEPPASITLFQGDGSFSGGWRALRRALDHRDHDVIHVHAPQTGVLLLAMALLSRRARARFGARPLAKAVYTVQNSYQNYRLRNRLLMVPIFLSYRRVVFCSESTRRSMTPLLRWATRRKGRVVPNCVDLDLIDGALGDQDASATPASSATKPFTVVSAGRLVPIKDPFLVLDAFAGAVPEGRLVYVGDGPLRAPLEEAVRERGLDGRVHFTGMVPRAAVYAQVAEADVYLSASHGEGLPVAVLEAMGCRCPVVLSDIPPHRELADGEAAVTLAPVGDVAGFADAIRTLVGMDAEARGEVGERCRRRIEQRYSLTVMHEAYRPIYSEAAAAGVSP